MWHLHTWKHQDPENLTDMPWFEQLVEELGFEYRCPKCYNQVKELLPKTNCLSVKFLLLKILFKCEFL